MLYKVNYKFFSLSQSKLSRGFTLVETIIGIVVLSIAFSIFTSLIFPLANQSAVQVHQIRAAELGQSMINEILGKAFDENSDMSGGFYRCGEDQNNDGMVDPVDGETCSAVLENEESDKRELFDDVDDYNGLSGIESSLGSDDSLNNIYFGFDVSVSVTSDSNYDGNPDDSNSNVTATAKLITVTVTTPQDSEYVFSVYKVNY
jgi:MSHA pilin protein MshD